MIVNMRYYGLVAAVSKKAQEDVELEEGATVQTAIDVLIQMYGERFKKELYFEGSYGDTKVSTPNLFLNKSRIQWVSNSRPARRKRGMGHPLGGRRWRRSETRIP